MIKNILTKSNSFELPIPGYHPPLTEEVEAGTWSITFTVENRERINTGTLAGLQPGFPSHTIQEPCLENGTAHSGLGLPTSMRNQDSPP